MIEAEKRLQDRLQKTLIPCAHCGSSGLLEKKGNSIAHWIVRCAACRAVVKGTTATDAADGWNRRPTMQLIRLPAESFLLPSGQKWAYIVVHEDNKVSFIDWLDGEIVGQIDIDLGHFYLARYQRAEERE